MLSGVEVLEARLLIPPSHHHGKSVGRGHLQTDNQARQAFGIAVSPSSASARPPGTECPSVRKPCEHQEKSQIRCAPLKEQISGRAGGLMSVPIRRRIGILSETLTVSLEGCCWRSRCAAKGSVTPAEIDQKEAVSPPATNSVGARPGASQ